MRNAFLRWVTAITAAIAGVLVGLYSYELDWRSGVWSVLRAAGIGFGAFVVIGIIGLLVIEFVDDLLDTRDPE